MIVFHQNHRNPHVDIYRKKIFPKPVQYRVTDFHLHCQQDNQKGKGNAHQVVDKTLRILGAITQQDELHRKTSENAPIGVLEARDDSILVG